MSEKAFMVMATDAREAIEDFNDFQGDRAIAWAADEITRLRAALESANQCRIELVTQVHELADHIERAACSVSDQDMQRQMLDQRLYSLGVVAQWNQNGNPFAVLPPPPVEKGKE